MNSPYLFDSHALLAFFQDEIGSDIVEDILIKTKERGNNPLLCIINMGEIIYTVKRRFGDQKKLEILGRINQLAFEILPAPNSLVLEAAEIKAEYPLAYADCFVVACALENSAVIVTGDPEFKHVEHLVNVKWIR